MYIFKVIDKTKYIVVLALLLVFSVFILSIHVSESFVKLNFPVKISAYFDYENISSTLISPVITGIFGRHEGAKGLKQRRNAVRQAKILCVSKFIPEKYINNVYATVKVPYYTEVCKLLTQLIVIYIFMTDGKKRSLKFSCIK